MLIFLLLAVISSLIAQFAVVDNNTNNTARVKVPRSWSRTEKIVLFDVDLGVKNKTKSTTAQGELFLEAS